LDRIIAIDGANYAHRANVRFAPNPAASRNTVEDNTMIYNFYRNLRATIEQFNPQKIFFCLEGHPQHRYDLLSSYKETRRIKTASATPEQKDANTKFFSDYDKILSLMSYLPITKVRHPHYECDDVIATLARSLKGDDFTIISNDTDYIQLLQDEELPNVKIYSAQKKEYLKAPEYHYLTWKCLAGDKSDNIKGPVGDKRAATLASNKDKLEAFLNIQENLDTFLLNKKLIEFSSVPEDEFEITEGTTDFSTLFLEFEKLDMPTMIEEKYWARFKKSFSSIAF
jgi:5'-3' exonuclease